MRVLVVCFCLFCCVSVLFVFFFKQKTAYEMRISDWSSDVCSSDLVGRGGRVVEFHGVVHSLWRVLRRMPGQNVSLRRRISANTSAGAEIGRASCRERVCQYV